MYILLFEANLLRHRAITINYSAHYSPALYSGCAWIRLGCVNKPGEDNYVTYIYLRGGFQHLISRANICNSHILEISTMKMYPLSRLSFSAAFLASGLLLFPLSGCKSTVSDATLTTNVKSALAADPSIGTQPITDTVQTGVVTLTGNVTDETASSVAAQDAAKVTGVKEVVNSLTVAGLAVAPTVTSPSAPDMPRVATPSEETAIVNHQPLPPPPSAPPAPAFRDITVPAGTPIPVRITQTLDSGSSQDGQPFNGIVVREVVADGMVVIPAGASVSGQVVDVKDATHFKGNSFLSIALTSLSRRTHTMAISTDPYSVEGKGRGRNTAEKIGGGAAIGAVLGGIFGGGKGAAIGAGAGAGGGAILQGSTRGQQVEIPSESVIRFRLANSITVRTAESPSDNSPNPYQQGLQQR
jgi:hypothetical protein